MRTREGDAASSVRTAGSAAGPAGPRSSGRRSLLVVLRVVAVLGLAVDVYLHLVLADGYDAIGTAITQGALFRVEAAVAVLAALLLAVRDSRLAWRAAGLVALAGTLAVVVTRFVEVPALGPLPALYEPAWYREKVQVTVMMLATVLAWVAREALWQVDARSSRRRSGSQLDPSDGRAPARRRAPGR